MVPRDTQVTRQDRRRMTGGVTFVVHMGAVAVGITVDNTLRVLLRADRVIAHARALASHSLT